MIEPRRSISPKNWDAFVSGKSADDIFLYNHILELCRQETLKEEIIVEIILTRLNRELDETAKRKQIDLLINLDVEHQKQTQQLQQEYEEINQRMEQSASTMDAPEAARTSIALTEQVAELTVETKELFDQFSDVHQQLLQEERKEFIKAIESNPNLTVVASDGSTLDNTMIATALSTIPPAPALSTIERVLSPDNQPFPDEKREHLIKSCSVMEELRMLSAVFNKDLSPAAFLRAIKLPANRLFMDIMHHNHDEAMAKRQDNETYTDCHSAYQSKSAELASTNAALTTVNERMAELDQSPKSTAPSPFSTRLDRK